MKENTCSWAWLALLLAVCAARGAQEQHDNALSSVGIQELLASLEKLSPELEGREDDIQFLKDMLQTEEFHSVMRVCDCSIVSLQVADDHTMLASIFRYTRKYQMLQQVRPALCGPTLSPS